MPDIYFAWPAWFGDTVPKVNIVGQLMQSASAGSTLERLECLAGEGRTKLPAPAVFWVLHPLRGVIWMDLLDLGRAKLVHLFYVVFYTKLMVMTLQKAGGSEHQEKLLTIAELTRSTASPMPSRGSSRSPTRPSSASA